jgi:peroxiredoxin
MIYQPNVAKVFLALLFFTSFFLPSCTQRIDIVTIDGFLKGNPKSYIYINKFERDTLIFVDSVKTNSDGYFDLKIPTEDYKFITLGIGKKQTQIILLVKPAEKVIVKSERNDLSDYKIMGSNGSALIYELTRRLNKTKLQIDSLQIEYKLNLSNPKLDSIRISLDSTYKLLIEKHRNYTISFIRNNPFSPASILALFQAYDATHPVLDYAKDQRLFRLVDSTLLSVYSSNVFIKSYHSKILGLDSVYNLRIKREKMYKVGETMPDIGYPLITGDNLFISGIWYRCILVDFWADWCDTCMENNNNLKAIYKEFGPKGLIIIQVSLGANPDSLKIQTARDSLFWYHASIQDYYHSRILDTLRITSVPSNYIADRRGVIRGVNLSGANLKEKLAELLP